MMLVIGVLFPVVYFNLFSANFLSWDDADYVIENKDVHSFNLKALITNFYVGNFHPLTMLNYALDWKLFGKSPVGYHVENMLWHLVNAILVFVISVKILKHHFSAFVIAIVFAFHPNQLENIAWVAERKNLLAAFFALCSVYQYLKFIETYKIKYLISCFILFACSLLSKPSAIVLPLVFILLDYYYDKLSWKKSMNKIPFIALALFMGILTMKAQEAGKFLNESHQFALHERIGYAGYAILQYLYKFLLPVNLSVIYPYPQTKVLSMVIGYGVIIVLAFVLYKTIKTQSKNSAFGLLFFLVNIVLVLQFIPFGEVLTADRYMYLPLIGLAFCLVSLIKLKDKQYLYLSVFLIITLSIFSFNRSLVWKNSIALYSDILKKYPHSYVALNSLGAEYMLRKDYQQSYKYLNMAINENANYYKGFYNRGLLNAQTNQLEKAIKDFNRAIELNNYPKAIVARANAYYMLNDFEKAKADAETALKLDPTNGKANFVLASCYDDANQLDAALDSYNKALMALPEEPLFYMRRAILKGKQKKYYESLADLTQCTELNPKFAEAYYWKGVVKVNLNINPCEDLRMAVNLGFMAAQQSLQNYCK